MNLELKPTKDNIYKTINEDIINRNNCLRYFINTLYKINDINVISLNGDWGAGKTFFIKQSIEVINSINSKDDSKIKNFIDWIKCTYLNDMDYAGQLMPIYYNAWEYDANEDPILTIMYSIINNNPKLKDFDKCDETLKEKIKRIISCFKGSVTFETKNGMTCGIELQCNDNKKEKITESVYTIENIKSVFSEILNEIKIEKANKVVIFIDELDRCNPNFAIRLMERVKHFFEREDYLFVFSTNIEELQYTVKKFYGEGIDGYSYLDKFFDLQFTLNDIDTDKYINSLNVLNNNRNSYINSIAKIMCKNFEFSLRKINRYFLLISLVKEQIYGACEKDSILSYCILFPILLAVKIKDINEYNKILSGQGRQELKNIVVHDNTLVKNLNCFFGCDELDGTLNFDFEKLYELIFIIKKNDGFADEKIGNVYISYSVVRKDLIELLSFMNSFVRI